MVQKIYSNVHHVSCINTHHDVAPLVNHGMIKNPKTWIAWEQNITFLKNKKILNLCLRWHILRSYCFAVEVTFKYNLWCKKSYKQTENHSKDIEDFIFNCVAKISIFFIFSVLFGYRTKSTNDPNKHDISFFLLRLKKHKD